MSTPSLSVLAPAVQAARGGGYEKVAAHFLNGGILLSSAMMIFTLKQKAAKDVFDRGPSLEAVPIAATNQGRAVYASAMNTHTISDRGDGIRITPYLKMVLYTSGT